MIVKTGKRTARRLINTFIRVKEEFFWILKNKPVPPPYFIKRRVIKKHAKKFSHKTFVETGTYMGDTVFSMKKIFKKIHSIELSKDLFEKAKTKFVEYPHITITQGDSAKELPLILSKINEPILFWLDGHYSEGITAKSDINTPIIKELESIALHNNKNHTILIDDARMFNGLADYPTIEKIKEFAAKNFPFHHIRIKDDIIRICKTK